MRGTAMKYLFAAGCMLKRHQGRFLPEIYHFLRERYGEVVVYHRSCRRKPLFSSDVTLISACEDCRENYADTPGVRVLSFWDLIDREQRDFFFHKKELPFPLKAASCEG